MKSKLTGLFFVIALLALLCSCDSKSQGVTIEKTPTCAVMLNSPEYTAAEAYCKTNNIKLVTYNTIEDAALAFENGKADYIVTNNVNEWILDEEIKSKAICTKLNGDVNYGAYFKKENSALCEKFNSEIKKMFDDGTMDKIVSGYINKEEFKIRKSTLNNGRLNVICAPVFENRFYMEDDNEPEGLDYVILNAICARLGYEAVLNPCDFEDMFSKLEKGEGDLIFSACEITEERRVSFLSSNPYFTMTFSVYKNK